MANKIPILIERTFIPHYLCPDLLEESFDHKSLYHTLTERYRLELDRAEETYEVRLLTVSEAKELGCKRNLPAFSIQRLAFHTGGGVVELTRSVGRGGPAPLLGPAHHPRNALLARRVQHLGQGTLQRQLRSLPCTAPRSGSSERDS